MANFTTDDFSGESSNVALSAHTASGGGTWTDHSSGITIAYLSENVYANAAGSQVSSHSGTPASADYTVSADYIFDTTGTASTHALAARVADQNNLYYARTTGTNWEIWKTVSGSTTRIGGPNADTLSNGTYALVFSVNGTALELTSGGVSKVTATDSAITAANNAGLRFFGNNTTNRIDNFSADDITAGGANYLTSKLGLLGIGI